MAWPCITRACCINRFWTELDKGDIAVPLVYTKYSDVADGPRPHVRPQKAGGGIAIETQPHPEEKAPPGAASAAAKDGSSSSVMRQDYKAWRVRPEPICKPRDQYQPAPAPFNNVTQYQKDYKAWPIPKKHDHPWIPKPSPTSTSTGSGQQLEHVAAEADSGLEKSEMEEKVQEKEVMKRKVKKEPVSEVKSEEVSAEQKKSRAAADALNRQIKEVMVMSTSSSYRTEFKAYKDVKPVKPIKVPPQYKPPGEETTLETSYSATYKGEQVKAHPTDNKLLERRRIRSLYSQPGKELAKDVSGTESSSNLNLL
ncbi:microtubule-associated protein 6 homolog isoform X2 [Gouania willdenowi]|uniref:microtubule-associated protein 6 homolog isoform X2 n=1 Tax=Gouania willdenowi TaxID=441366 RepID=UPI0010548338|nr:microtubule-associated protein 6 isoform X2 [Gouania willdenowi]